MIAEIIPIKRLPRRFSHFDYTVPEEMKENIAPGQLVRIPLKSSELFGLVLTLRETRATDTSALKEVIDIVHAVPILSEKYLEQLQTLSQWYGVSYGTLANMMLLPLQKRKIKTISLTASKQVSKSAEKKITFHLYNNEQEHKQLLQEQINESANNQILFLVPEIQYIDTLMSHLQEYQGDIVIWHSGLSTKEQFERWLEIRNGEKKIIIGTRGALLLPFFNLEKVVIDYEEKDNHKHWDQAPRFHVKDVAELLRTTQGVDVHLMSFSPSVDSYYNVHKKNYTSTNCQIADVPNCQIADLTNERRAGNASPLSEKLQTQLRECTESAFLYLNRLGLATYIGCNGCGWRALCPSCKLPQTLHEKNKQLSCHYCKTTQPLPTICPACKEAIVTLSGVGTETVEKVLNEFVKEHNLPHQIVRIDSQTNFQIATLPNCPIIVIGTDTAFSYIQWQETSLIAFLDIDMQLSIPEFGAEESLWHLIQNVQYLKREDASFIIQTREPKHLIFKSLAEPDRFYRTDLNHRMKLGYPPYKYLVRYFYGHANFLEAKKVMETSVVVLKKRLQEQHKDIALTDSFDMHPRYYRGRHWFAVMARLSPESWQEDLVWLNGHIPETWKIDPHPISILSP
ncbi:MAG: Primosomal protein N [Candidatus Magasanikbacteria bacterium GW2011_GWD2_43_18]|uniref:Primosomal protein N n=1 Tax=Candidatus Magasanikbacteria bacterium GW2011_GWE2_42_7 TaxID=1619052 RepID=A0A0G1DNW3_9BACT|nr:MAG: Primosomal protein N [Candidatus Magasanikbacteria bacterium GW2011_GWE2_42_7]KKT03399.1 MAG: Primosomal protein N [Candidatus Magasanikbacteria bacterium GW2011_GWD2_43_18]KKT25279.1 MAG: Primosomal protein N [Candidatus Magasanikbacteria bacterium GW2011_GWA2_43_9]HBB38591.1 primosomal protein N' [Candidatus Magasanikbacteria bacterium]HCC13862.1 primosomal protein N' [Candidatus Magasanikbacteria bacterium]